MDIETAIQLIDDIELLGVSPRTFGAQVEYRASRSTGPEQVVNTGDIADEFDVPVDTVRRVFKRLRTIDIAHSSGEGGGFEIDLHQLRTVTDRLEWLAQPPNRDYIYPGESRTPDRIEMVTGSPYSVDRLRDPNITGRLVDMIANASDTVTVVNPFFTSDGLDLVIDAMVGATRSDTQLRLLTRDVYLGKDSNRREVTRLIESVERSGDSTYLEVFEVDKREFPEASLHAKVTVADRARAYVGSANLTDQSLQHAVEIGLYIEGGLVDQIADYLDQCQMSDLFVPVQNE